MGRTVPSYRFSSTRVAVAAIALGALLAIQSGGSATAQEGPVAGGGFQIKSSSPQALRLAVQAPEPAWREDPLQSGEGEVRYELLLDGFNSSGGPGAPRVPGLSSWIVVPAGTRPVLKVVSEQWNDAGGRALAVEAVPVVRPGAGEEPGSVSEILVLPGQAIPDDARVPDGAREAFEKARVQPLAAGLQLGDEVWWRGRRLVSVSLNAVRLGPGARAQSVLGAGEWEIRFEPVRDAVTQPKGMHALKSSSRGDDRFATGFLNGGLLKSQPTEATLHPTAAVGKAAPRKAKGTLLAPEVRLPVTGTRMTVVSYAALRAEGLIPADGFQESQVRVYQRRYLPRLTESDIEALPYLELEVPIQMVGEGDGFDGDDYFCFQALHLRDDAEFEADLGEGLEPIPGAGDPYQLDNKYNWYWLALSEPDAGDSWARMETTTLPAASATPLPNYRRRDHHENQVAFRHNVPTVSTDRIWANHYRDTEVTVNLGPLWSPDPAGSSALIQFMVSSYNVTSDTTQIRHMRFGLEIVGQDELALAWYYPVNFDTPRTLAYSLTPAQINGLGGLFRMQEWARTGNRMYAYLNWVELTYDALYSTFLDQLTFNAGEEAGARPIEVTGFTNPDLLLWDITDPRQPRSVDLSTANIVADGDTWTLTIQPTQSGETREYYVTTRDELLDEDIWNWVDFDSEIVEDPVDPRLASSAAPDLIVVTHPDFRDALQRWVQHRIDRSGGELEVHIVDVDDLFDMYSGGLRDDWAIKRFVEYSIAKWGSWALVIVGDANENARELQVQQSARAFSKDWVPTHYHVQKSFVDEPELMATDKWYVCSQYGEDYPYDDFPEIVSLPWQMMTGRLPCNSTTELNAMIDKIIVMETPEEGQDWRRRGIFFADDAWSEEYGDEGNAYTYESGELEFESSERDSLAYYWETGTPIAMVPDTLYLASYLNPYEDETAREINAYRGFAEDDAVPDLMAALNRGGLIAHYQGHANAYVLASEHWLVDRIVYNRRDVNLLANRNRPWVFFGMGCHVSDWAQNTVITSTSLGEQSLGEKLMIRSGAGAAATYGSSGFEYITHNAVYSEYILRRWMVHPPGGPLSPAAAPADRSRWILGEILWAADAELLARRAAQWQYPEMVAQYQLLGDPLMVLDGGEPEVTATLVGEPDAEITDDTIELMATDASNLRTVTVHALDEAGIASLKVWDSRDGVDRFAQWGTETLPDGAVDYRIVDYRLDLPIRPYRHSLVVEVHDTGAPLASDRAWRLQLDVPMEAEFSLEGAVIDTSDFQFTAGEPVNLQANITSGAWLDGGMEMGLTSDNLTLSNIVFEVEKSNEIVVYFTAMAEDDLDVTRSVDLAVDGYTTTLTIEGVDPAAPLAGVERLFNFPNPVAEGTDFVFEATTAAQTGRIRIFSLSGRQVANLDITPSHFKGANRWCVPWNGRDAEGDRLANGTYLYRVEMQMDGGQVASDVQRLVMMR